MSATASESDPRRDDILGAVLRITARSGVDGVSVRTVAVAAGCSVGMVQRLFGTKDELLSDAMRAALTRIEERIGRRFAELTLDGSPRAALEELIVLLAGSDRGPEREDLAVWLAFLARAVVVPRLAAELREYYRPGQDAAADLLRRAQELGLVPRTVDPTMTAVALLALADGLSAHLLIGRIGPEEARRCVSDYLDALFQAR